MKVTEIKPCPFCGSENVERATHSEFVCECGLVAHFVLCSTEEHALRCWNRRAALSSEAGQGEAQYPGWQIAAWQGRDYADGWINFDTQAEAQQHALETGAAIRATYVRIPEPAQPRPEPPDDVAELIAKLRRLNPWQDMDWPETLQLAADTLERLTKAQAAVPVAWQVRQFIREIGGSGKWGRWATYDEKPNWGEYSDVEYRPLYAAPPTPLRKAFEAGLTYAANVKVTDVDQAWRDVAAALAEQEKANG